MHRSRSRGGKLCPVIFEKAFFEVIKRLYKIYSLQKNLFQKIIKLDFLTLDHVLRISDTYCNYFLCSLYPGESIGNN